MYYSKVINMFEDNQRFAFRQVYYFTMKQNCQWVFLLPEIKIYTSK